MFCGMRFKSHFPILNQALLALCLIFVSIAPVFAGACYTQKEAEAEQGIKIQSELMVIGLNCAHKAKDGDPSLYVQYQIFSRAHLDLFQGYEETLLGHYTSLKMEDPDDALKKLRTGFANQISSEAAGMRPDVFCYYYAPRITKATELSRDQVRQWASMDFTTHPTTKPLCANLNY